MGLKKKGREHCSKIESVNAQKTQRKTNLGERVEKMYVLKDMSVTFPTAQAERSPLKAAAQANTAPQFKK